MRLKSKSVMTGRVLLTLGLLAVALLALPRPALAVDPSEMLKDPVLEHRAREISQKLRCLVCQNESIDASDADLAHDLRVLVRKRLTEGETNKQVIDYIVSRYGDFVLLRPPVEARTLPLWFGPGVIGLLGLVAVFLFYRRRRTQSATPTPLTPEEQARLRRLMETDSQ